ncbi:hypothetical protein ACIKTA_02370 [Hansschlegelia beijingensis]|uniref:hypothetical protein n=1 Tax=Hansschlegelia beijingensis TaxID=1133344 RepID=UPI0037F2C01C
MKTIIYAIGALALSCSMASAHDLTSRANSGYATVHSERAAASSRGDGSVETTGSVRVERARSYPAPQTTEEAIRWDADRNNG